MAKDSWYVLYVVTLFGSFAMYVFSLHQGFEGSVKFLKRMFPRRKKVFYDRVDFFIVIFAGSFIGYVFFEPQTTPQALAAGLGWVSSVNVMLNRIDNEEGS